MLACEAGLEEFPSVWVTEVSQVHSVRWSGLETEWSARWGWKSSQCELALSLLKLGSPLEITWLTR